MPFEPDPFELTYDDRYILELGKVERYRIMAKLPDTCAVHLDLNYDLNLFCCSIPVAEAMRTRLEELRSLAYLILGAELLLLYGNDTLIWSGNTRTLAEGGLESEAIGFVFEEDDMVAATIDREAIAQTTREEIRPLITAQVDDVIRGVVNEVLDENALQVLVKERLTFLFGGLASPNGNGAIATMEPPTATTAAPAKPKPLKLPSQTKLEAMVTNRYPSVLKQLIPTGERDRYITAITTETPEGKEWMMKIAAAVFKKYQKPDEAAIYGYLLSNARKLQAI